jgi:hypothetical protein
MKADDAELSRKALELKRAIRKARAQKSQAGAA